MKKKQSWQKSIVHNKNKNKHWNNNQHKLGALLSFQAVPERPPREPRRRARTEGYMKLECEMWGVELGIFFLYRLLQKE